MQSDPLCYLSDMKSEPPRGTRWDLTVLLNIKQHTSHSDYYRARFCSSLVEELKYASASLRTCNRIRWNQPDEAVPVNFHL